MMEPVTKLIDKVEEKLGHSPHPMVVTLPLGAWAVSNICDVLGLVTGERAYDDTARISMGIGLLGASTAVVTGLRDFAGISKERPSHAIATRHAIGNAIVGSLISMSYLMRQRDRRPGLMTRMLALAGGGLGVYTAWLGGKLVEEHGEGVKPVMEELKVEEENRRQTAQPWQRQPAGVIH